MLVLREGGGSVGVPVYTRGRPMKVMQYERLFSSDLYVEGPTPARYWGDQWLRVCEKLLKGLNHQFTNRVSSLDAAIGMLEEDGASSSGFATAMSAEVARLHELLLLYRSLTAEPVAAPELTRMQDVMPQIVRLHEHHSDLRHIPCELSGNPETEPILVRQSALLRCIMVLLTSVSGNVLRSKREGSVTIEYGTDDGDVFLRMAGTAPNGQLLFSGEGSLLHAVRAALAHAHATAEGAINRGPEADRIEYHLRIPTLTKARSTEQ